MDVIKIRRLLQSLSALINIESKIKMVDRRTNKRSFVEQSYNCFSNKIYLISFMYINLALTFLYKQVYK